MRSDMAKVIVERRRQVFVAAGANAVAKRPLSRKELKVRGLCP